MPAEAKPGIRSLEDHRHTAEEAYRALRPLYAEFCKAAQRIIEDALAANGVKVASIQARAKTVESYGAKAAEPSEREPTRPKYTEPMMQITDLAGVRVITFFPRTVELVQSVVEDEFAVLERSDKSETLRREDKFGYQSVHYLVRLKQNRTQLPEYGRFAKLVAEIQIRTILQHAWAEIEHDIQYKSVETIPTSLRRRFMSLAGLFEIADREFQTIQDDDQRLRNHARQSVAQGNLKSVEITPDSLKAYLDKRLGADGRMVDGSYDWAARMLLVMGFSDVREVDECIAGYDDDRLSRIAHGSRRGQLTRFETQLEAGMGTNFITTHPWREMEWFRSAATTVLQKLTQSGIPIRNYEPSKSTLKKEALAKSIKGLIRNAEKNGYLTYEDINEALPETVVKTDDLDAVLLLLREMDIEVVDAGPDEKPKTDDTTPQPAVS